MPKKKILITGATGLLGLNLLNALDSRGHEVFTMQRKPPPDVERRPHLGANWLQANLEYADEMVAAFHRIVSDGEVMDAVVHLAFHSVPVDFDLMSPADIDRALRVNVTNPLMLTKYMLDFGALKKTGLVIFPEDDRVFAFDQIPTAISVGSRRPAVETFFRSGTLFSNLRVVFAEYRTNDTDLDLMIEQVRRCLESDPELVPKEIRLRK